MFRIAILITVFVLIMLGWCLFNEKYLTKVVARKAEKERKRHDPRSSKCASGRRTGKRG
jgi:hypothetical protein